MASQTQLRGAASKPPVPTPSHDHDHDHSHDGHDHSHAGHSHGLLSSLTQSHSHGPNELLLSKDKTDPGVRITRIGLYVNLMMAISKGVGGYVFNSRALIADAVHALTDLVSDFMTLATVSWALRNPTDRFPNGFGKIESLGSLGVSSLLLFGGLAMGWNSAEHILTGLMGVDLGALGGHGHSHGGHGHGHSHSHTDLGPNINAAWLAGGSIIVKEWLYRATMKIAKEKQSSVLASNAVHHRIDSLTAMVALISISLSNVLHNAAWLDPVGGLLVSLMVIRAGWTNSRASLLELADTGLGDDFKRRVKGAAEGLDGVKVDRVSGTKSGQNFLVEVWVIAPGSMTVTESRTVEEDVRRTVGAKVKGVKRVKVHFVPEGETVLSEFVGLEVMKAETTVEKAEVKKTI